jgi:hypothetical protein
MWRQKWRAIGVMTKTKTARGEQPLFGTSIATAASRSQSGVQWIRRRPNYLKSRRARTASAKSRMMIGPVRIAAPRAGRRARALSGNPAAPGRDNRWFTFAFGCDEIGRPRTARGIVAIGQRAVGVVACGIIAGGMFSIGFVAIGFFSLGVVSIALGCAVGLNAIGPVAIGVTAVGAVAGGLAPFGSRILFTTPPIAP